MKGEIKLNERDIDNNRFFFLYISQIIQLIFLVLLYIKTL